MVAVEKLTEGFNRGLIDILYDGVNFVRKSMKTLNLGPTSGCTVALHCVL